jgi:hypothetical protein
MILVPSEKILLKSKLPASEVCQRLSSALLSHQTGNVLFNGRYGKPFEGVMVRNRFEMNELRGYTGSLKPQLKGKVISDLEGSWIEFTMHFQRSTSMFIWIWVLMLFTGGLAAFTILFAKGGAAHLAFIPIALLPISVALFLAKFHVEAERSVSTFKKLLAAKVVKRRH